MTRIRFLLNSISIAMMISFILGQAMATQTDRDNTSNSDLILFNRLDMNRELWPYSIVVLDTHTGEELPVTLDGFCCAASWSPDGNQILVSVIKHKDEDLRPTSLWVIDADGRNRQRLNIPELIDPSRPRWSHDGERIFFWGRDTQAETRHSRWAIYDVSISDGNARRLTEPSEHDGGLAISPDNSQIFFTQNNTLYTMASNGDEPRQIDVSLSFGNIFRLSPDGSMIALLAFNQTNDNNLPLELHVMSSDGSNARMLVTDMGSITNLSWSPDGSELLFKGNHGTDEELFGIVNVATGELDTYENDLEIFESLNRIGGAMWSGDGTQIVISGVFKENNPYDTFINLYLVDRNFTQIQRLTTGEYRDSPVQWRP